MYLKMFLLDLHFIFMVGAHNFSYTFISIILLFDSTCLQEQFLQLKPSFCSLIHPFLTLWFFIIHKLAQISLCFKVSTQDFNFKVFPISHSHCLNHISLFSLFVHFVMELFTNVIRFVIEDSSQAKYFFLPFSNAKVNVLFYWNKLACLSLSSTATNFGVQKSRHNKEHQLFLFQFCFSLYLRPSYNVPPPLIFTVWALGFQKPFTPFIQSHG